MTDKYLYPLGVISARQVPHLHRRATALYQSLLRRATLASRERRDARPIAKHRRLTRGRSPALCPTHAAASIIVER